MFNERNNWPTVDDVVKQLVLNENKFNTYKYVGVYLYVNDEGWSLSFNEYVSEAATEETYVSYVDINKDSLLKERAESLIADCEECWTMRNY